MSLYDLLANLTPGQSVTFERAQHPEHGDVIIVLAQHTVGDLRKAQPFAIPVGREHPEAESRLCTLIRGGLERAAQPATINARAEPGTGRRYSTLLRDLRAEGNGKAADAIANLYADLGSKCPTHGDLEDPLVFLAGDGRVAFVCPFCSGEEHQAAWVADGKDAPS